MKSIAVIPKSTTQVFWKAVEAGTREGAKEVGVEMVWKGSLKEDDPHGRSDSFPTAWAALFWRRFDEKVLKRPVAAAYAERNPCGDYGFGAQGRDVQGFCLHGVDPQQILPLAKVALKTHALGDLFHGQQSRRWKPTQLGNPLIGHSAIHICAIARFTLEGNETTEFNLITSPRRNYDGGEPRKGT
jgi:hypothetical protein